MLMRRIVLVVSVLFLAGCTNSPATTPVIPAEEPQVLTGLRGTSLDGPECARPESDNGAVAQPTPDTEIPRPTSLTLCLPGRRTFRITADDPMFGRVLSGLSTPDQSGRPSACLSYAEAPGSLVAGTGDGYFLVHIPEDGCGHYNGDVKAALYAGDSVQPPDETPTTGATAGLRSVNWKNVTVSGEACFSSSPIHLHKGYALIPNRNGYPNQPDGDGRRYYRLTLLKVSYGDLDGNGVSEALVNLYCSNNGGTGAGRLLTSLAIYSGTDRDLHELGILTPQIQEERRQATLLINPSLIGGKLSVQEGFFGKRDSDCCPSGNAITVWTYSKGTFAPHTTVTKPPR